MSSENSIARYLVKVDPQAAEPVVIEPVREPMAAPQKPGMRSQTTTALGSGQTVLLGTTPQVTVTGPGTYDQATHTMSAPVTITHNDSSASDFDELQMVITGITSTGNIQFVTTNNGNTGVGAVIAMTDIQGANSASSVCGTGVKQQSAFHALRIVDPTDVKFTFTIDVRANAGSGSAISPDCDSDGYNAEVGQDAGNDCNNKDASVSPATTATCACSTSSCTTTGASCALTPTTGSSYTCNNNAANNPSLCVCDINPQSPSSDVTATCSKSCTFECNGVTDSGDTGSDACTGTCSGVTCGYSCSNLSNNADCSYTCNAGTCALSCSNTNATNDCQYTQCQNSASCTSTCPGGAGACGTATCNKSNCNVDCGTSSTSTFAGTCGVSTQCNNSATCTVSCAGTGTGVCGVAKCTGSSSCDVTCGSATEGTANFGDYCGIGDCRNGAACNVTCTNSPDCYLLCTGSNGAARAGSCSMDCSALSAADQNSAKCNLDCRSPWHKVPLGGGFYECQL